MKRIKLTIAYDGTDFHGFQKQPGLRTVEGELIGALSETTGEDISIEGLSRTDAGVHALGNEIAFNTLSGIPAEKFMYAARKFLPRDITIVSGEEVPSGFELRKRPVTKTYEYRLYVGKSENPLKRRYYAYSERMPDAELMRKGAEFLVGEHDFRAFANPDSFILKEGLSPVRTVTGIDIDIEKEAGFFAGDSAVCIRVSGSGFLYNMVRIMAGTLFEVGYGRMEPEYVGTILDSFDRCLAGPTMEARGLTLIGANFD